MKKKINFKAVGYLIGVGILLFIISRLPFDYFAKSINKIGYGLFVIFLTAIPWIMFNTLSLASLVSFKVNFFALLYNQLTGEAYNLLLPLAGLGGEPYKIKHLSDYIGLKQASHAIVQDRLIHIFVSFVFTVFTVSWTLLTVPLKSEIILGMVLVIIMFSLISLLMTYAFLSSKTTKFFDKILLKFKIFEDYREESLSLSKGKFFLSFLFKFIGRCLNFLEIFAIFYFLGFNVSLDEIIVLSAFLNMSSNIFFMIPQGIGVNELGIAGAFRVIGSDLSAGLFFGIIRRARIVFWAVLGVLLHSLNILDKKIIHKKVKNKI